MAHPAVDGGGRQSMSGADVAVAPARSSPLSTTAYSFHCSLTSSAGSDAPSSQTENLKIYSRINDPHGLPRHHLWKLWTQYRQLRRKWLGFLHRRRRPLELPGQIVRPASRCHKNALVIASVFSFAVLGRFPAPRAGRTENRVNDLHVAEGIFERHRDFGVFEDGAREGVVLNRVMVADRNLCDLHLAAIERHAVGDRHWQGAVIGRVK